MDANPAKRRKLDYEESYESGHNGSGLDAAAAAGSYRPSTFILETEELLKESRINYEKAFAHADNLLHRVKGIIEKIKPQDPTFIGEASTKFEKKYQIRVPYPDPKPEADSQYKVLFASPSQFNVVGSYVSRTQIRSQKDRSIDMIMEMPRDIFQDKDHLNLRYFYKRAYYLAVVTASLRKNLGSTVDLSYEHLHGNQLLPVLSVAVGRSGEEKDTDGKSSMSAPEYRVRIIPSAPEGLFPKKKLLPTSNCLRKGVDEQKESPTPFYNSTLKAESSYIAHLKVLHHAEKTCPSFKDACILGRVWLQQRGFGSSISDGGFGHCEWALLLALLLLSKGKGRKGMPTLSPSLSSTQLFKALVQYLAMFELSKKPLILGFSSEGMDATRDVSPVIFDAIQQLNIAFKMSPWSATMLQQHAKWTHTLMADQAADHFNPTFIIKPELLQIFDILIRLERPDSPNKNGVIDYRGAAWEFSDKVSRIVKKALGDRVQLVHVQEAKSTEATSWDLSSSPVPKSSDVLVGLLFNTVNMARQVDHGPPVEDKKEAKRFRQFWGEKAELRKFKDGTIMESLIWTKTLPSALCEEVVRYILRLHLHLQDSHFHFYGSKAFETVVPIKSSDAVAFQAAREAFSVFEQDIRGLEDLPLHINQVVATAPELRSSTVRPPPFNISKGAPMDTVVFFEASGKWPENLAAIQRVKVAFLLRIGSLLEASKSSVTTHIGLEDANTEIESLAYLDVLYENGAAFRLRVHSDLEESLLDRRCKDKTVDQHVRTEGARLLASFKRLYTHLPLHTQTISTCCTRFSALSGTIRLVKHWFDSHKLSCHFLIELIELFALQVFLEPYGNTPSSPGVGFLRTLQFLARWDWRVNALILDSAGSMSASDHSAVRTRLEAWRKIDPSMNHTTLFVATSQDMTGTAYSINDGRPAPSKVVATRMSTLARSACKLVKEQGLDLNPRALFQPSLSEYDVLIKLNNNVVKGLISGDNGTTRAKYKNLDERTGKTQLPVQHPVRAFLKQLEALYSSPLLFFHGNSSDLVIAGIWNPQLKQRTLRVNLPASFKPSGTKKSHKDGEDEEDEELVDVNREGIIAEIARIGGELVEKIETRA